jgi:hypothetical protein
MFPLTCSMLTNVEEDAASFTSRLDWGIVDVIWKLYGGGTPRWFLIRTTLCWFRHTGEVTLCWFVFGIVCSYCVGEVSWFCLCVDVCLMFGISFELCWLLPLFLVTIFHLRTGTASDWKPNQIIFQSMSTFLWWNWSKFLVLENNKLEFTLSKGTACPWLILLYFRTVISDQMATVWPIAHEMPQCQATRIEQLIFQKSN